VHPAVGAGAGAGPHGMLAHGGVAAGRHAVAGVCNRVSLCVASAHVAPLWFALQRMLLVRQEIMLHHIAPHVERCCIDTVSCRVIAGYVASVHRSSMT
jgi:hypothetical protein